MVGDRLPLPARLRRGRQTLAVGNDIVDLRDPETRSAHPRFASRVGAPRDDVWLHFAAKEAAYKALHTLDSRVRPIPRRFVVDPEAGEVRHEGSVLPFVAERNEDFVHVVAWVGEPELLSGWGPVQGDPSADVRRRLCEGVAPLLGVEAGELQVERAPLPGSWDGLAPPRLLLRERPLPLDICLSHHGRYVAWAAALPG